MKRKDIERLIKKLNELNNSLFKSKKYKTIKFFDKIIKRLTNSKSEFIKKYYIKKILKLGKLPDTVGFNAKQEDLFDQLFNIAEEILENEGKKKR